jgi:hypothetical protein
MPYSHILYNSDPVEWRYRINVIPYVVVQHKFDFASGERINQDEGFDKINAVPPLYGITVEWRFGINVMPYSYWVDQV